MNRKINYFLLTVFCNVIFIRAIKMWLKKGIYYEKTYDFNLINTCAACICGMSD